MSDDALLTLENVIVGFRGRTLSRAITRRWLPGTYIIRGPNGCGKSTLLRTCCGIIPPQAGCIHLGPHRLDHHPVAAKTLLGYGPDRIPLPATALAGELLRLTAWGRGDGRDLGRTSIAERLEIKTFLDRRVAALSLGQCRRLILTATLAAEPAIALLDEPTVGLDVDGIRHLVAIIEERQRQGRLTICVTHENWAIALPFAELISWSEFATVESSCNR